LAAAELDLREVYMASRKGVVFRKGVSAFILGFIVSGSQLKTPVNSCRIKGIAPAAKGWIMKLDCTGSVSTMEGDVQFSLADDGAIVRYLYAEDRSGSRYERCTARDLQAKPKG
jgi:hypothetical protein